MDSITNNLTSLIGHKIEQIRKLRGLSQAKLGERLGGISKQAVSKMEQSREIDDARLRVIANALEVTFEGLKNFDKDRVLHYTINFYEKSVVNDNPLNSNAGLFINYEIEKTFVFFEKQLAAMREELKKALVKDGGRSD